MDFAKFDKRIIDRNLKNGSITPKEYQDYLKGLEDLAENAQRIRVPLYPWDAEAADPRDGDNG